MTKKLAKESLGLTLDTAGLSIGSSVLGKLGGPIAGQGQAGITSISKILPIKGTLIGAKGVFREIKKFKKLKF